MKNFPCLNSEAYYNLKYLLSNFFSKIRKQFGYFTSYVYILVINGICGNIQLILVFYKCEHVCGMCMIIIVLFG